MVVPLSVVVDQTEATVPHDHDERLPLPHDEWATHLRQRVDTLWDNLIQDRRPLNAPAASNTKPSHQDKQPTNDKNREQQHTGDPAKTIMMVPLMREEFPIARVKRIMKSDACLEPRMVGVSAATALSYLAEVFTRRMTTIAWAYTDSEKRRTLQIRDIINAINSEESSDFLLDVVDDFHRMLATKEVTNKDTRRLLARTAFTPSPVEARATAAGVRTFMRSEPQCLESVESMIESVIGPMDIAAESIMCSMS